MASRRTPDLSRNPEPNPAKKRARARTATRVGQQPSVIAASVALSIDSRRAMIAEAAYLRAEQRGFASGHEEEDWLLAEREVDALLSAHHGHAAQ
jgi:hypothetical protein